MVAVATVAAKADATKAVHQGVRATVRALKLAVRAKKHATQTHAATVVVAHNAMVQVVAVKAAKAVVTAAKVLGQSAATKLLAMHQGVTAVVVSAKTANAVSHVTTAAHVNLTHCVQALTP